MRKKGSQYTFAIYFDIDKSKNELMRVQHFFASIYVLFVFF